MRKQTVKVHFQDSRWSISDTGFCLKPLVFNVGFSKEEVEN